MPRFPAEGNGGSVELLMFSVYKQLLDSYAEGNADCEAVLRYGKFGFENHYI